LLSQLLSEVLPYSYVQGFLGYQSTGVSQVSNIQYVDLPDPPVIEDGLRDTVGRFRINGIGGSHVIEENPLGSNESLIKRGGLKGF
jgi:hypothetical protein